MVTDIKSANRSVSILVAQVSCSECLADFVLVTEPPTRIHIDTAVMISNEAGRLVHCPECNTAMVLTREAVLSTLKENSEGV